MLESPQGSLYAEKGPPLGHLTLEMPPCPKPLQDLAAFYAADVWKDFKQWIMILRWCSEVFLLIGGLWWNIWKMVSASFFGLCSDRKSDNNNRIGLFLIIPYYNSPLPITSQEKKGLLRFRGLPVFKKNR